MGHLGTPTNYGKYLRNVLEEKTAQQRCYCLLRRILTSRSGPLGQAPWRPARGTENFRVGLGVRGSSVILVSVVSVERGWQRLAWTDSSSESGSLLMHHFISAWESLLGRWRAMWCLRMPTSSTAISTNCSLCTTWCINWI